MLSGYCKSQRAGGAFGGSLWAFLLPHKILANGVQLLFFYLVLKGIREICFEDLDLARARYFDFDDPQQTMPSSSFKLELLEDVPSRRSIKSPSRGSTKPRSSCNRNY